MPKFDQIPTITPSELQQILEFLDTLDNPPALMVYGVPGIGKTTIVKKFAADRNYDLRIKHLSRMDPTDWTGIPSADSDYTNFKPIGLFRPPQEGKQKIVIFFDELNTALPQVLNSALDVILEKRGDTDTYGEKAILPQNTIIVAAGNLGPEFDGTYVEEFSSAVKTRLVQVKLETSFNDWKQWAENNGIEKVVIKFLERNQSYLVDIEGLKNNADQVPTPRGWERVSDYIKKYKFEKKEVLEKLILGTIGEKIGKEFIKFFNNFAIKKDEIRAQLQEYLNYFRNPDVNSHGYVNTYLKYTNEVFHILEHIVNIQGTDNDIKETARELLNTMWENFWSRRQISTEVLRTIKVSSPLIDYVVNILGCQQYNDLFNRITSAI